MKTYTTKSPVNCGPCSFINLTGLKGTKALENELAKEKLKPFQISVYSSFLVWGDKYARDVQVYTSSKVLNEKMFKLMTYYEKTPPHLVQKYKQQARKGLALLNKKYASKIHSLNDPLQKIDELLQNGNKVAVLLADYYLDSSRAPVPHWVVVYKRVGNKYYLMDSAQADGSTVLTKAALQKAIKLDNELGFCAQLVAYKERLRILAIGDFHGEFPKKWERLIKKEKIDLVLSNGDYLPFHYRKLWFEHCYLTDVGLWEVIGKKKYKQLLEEDLRRGESVFKAMNALPVPVITVFGNIDYPDPSDVTDRERKRVGKNYWKWSDDYRKETVKVIKKYKNLHRIDYKAKTMLGYAIIGGRGHSFPGHVKSKGYKKYKAKLDALFRKYKKENKERNVIFLTHNVPYNTKLDKISSKADKKVRGKHYGSKMFRRLIDKYQPVLHIGGHIHEGKGKQLLGKTMCVNPGAAHEGEAAIIELDGKKRPKVTFIK